MKSYFDRTLGATFSLTGESKDTEDGRMYAVTASDRPGIAWWSAAVIDATFNDERVPDGTYGGARKPETKE